MSEPVDMTVPEYQGTDHAGALYRVGVRGRIVRELDASAARCASSISAR